MNRTATTSTTRRKSLGFTLIELCACLGICAALVGQAVPSLGKMFQERALRATADALASDLRFARSEAARTTEPVYFRISGKGSAACYLLHTGPRNDCDCAEGKAICKSASSAVIKAEWMPSNRPIRLSSNAESLQFQRRQGLVTQTGSIQLSLTNGPAIRHIVAITGRVRSCYTTVKFSGMSKCA